MFEEIDEWGEFQSAPETTQVSKSGVDVTFEIAELFPEFQQAYEKVESILDQKSQIVRQQNLERFRNMDTSTFDFPEMDHEESLDSIKEKLDIYTSTAVHNAERQSNILVKTFEGQWKDALREVSHAQRQFRLYELNAAAIEATTERIAALEKDVRSDISLKPELKKQYAILETLQSMGPENQKDKVTAEINEDVYSDKATVVDRVSSLVNKVGTELRDIKKKKIDDVENYKTELLGIKPVATLGWTAPVLTTTGFAFPILKPVTAPLAGFASALYSAITIRATRGSDKQLTEQVRSGELDPLLKGETTHLNETTYKTSKARTDVTLAEKIDAPSSMIGAVASTATSALDSFLPGVSSLENVASNLETLQNARDVVETVSTASTVGGTAGYVGAVGHGMHMDNKSEKDNKMVQQKSFAERVQKPETKGVQSFEEKEKVRQVAKNTQRQASM